VPEWTKNRFQLGSRHTFAARLWQNGGNRS
jgi:hypothetical protein